ncbi:MAG: trypsin-like peptidase domain-containing protein [Acidobacteriota bacterium]
MVFRTAGSFLMIALMNVAALQAGEPTTAGEHVFDRFDSPHPYPSSGESRPMLTWTDHIRFPGATYIAPHFKRMALADGDFVVVRSPDGHQKWTYTGHGRRDLGATSDGFFATHIRGDEVVVELFTSGNARAWGYSIDKFGRGFNDDEIRWFWSQGLGEKMNLVRPAEHLKSLCTQDDSVEAKCFEGIEPEIYEKSRSIARILLNGSAWCTGWLVGSSGHVMTTASCIENQAELDTADFEFMAEGSDCATDCASSLGCHGTIEASGGSFTAGDGLLDFALLLPDTSTAAGTDLPVTYGFLQMRQTGAELGERVYHPQHPAGWGKRIVMNSTYPDDVAMGGFCYASSLTEAPCTGAASLEVGYWTDTQGGSAGSPIIGYSDHKVVALHHCRGVADCATGNSGIDDRNRGVPVEAVITALGAAVPPDAVCQSSAGPSVLSAVSNGDNRVDLSWDAVPGTGITYKVKRAAGSCPSTAYDEIASGITDIAYSDTTVSGGVTYSFVVLAEDGTTCDSDPSPCADVTAAGSCIEPPVFGGLSRLTNPQTALCGLELEWSEATPVCDLTAVYNVHRSRIPGFHPDPTNLVASCLTGTTYVDAHVASQEDYYYIVRVEDGTANGSGPCNGGNEDGNLVEASAAATGPELVAFADDMESGGANWTHGGVGDTWTLSTARAHSGSTSFFAVDTDNVTDQTLESVEIVLPVASSISLEFWSSQEIEHMSGGCLDGGIIEASNDGGSSWVPLPGTTLLKIPYDGTVWYGFGNPLSTFDAWCGDPRDWGLYEVDLSGYAGQAVKLRFRLGTDNSVGHEGWYIDDVRVISPTECVEQSLIFADGFGSGDTTLWSATVP